MTSPSDLDRGSPHLLLAVGAGLLMTGHGMGMPVFAIALKPIWPGAVPLSILFFTFSIVYAVLSPLGGALADWMGRRTLMIVGALLAVVSNVTFVFAEHFASFLVARMAQGAAIAAFLPAALAMVDDYAPGGRRAERLGIVMAGFGAGFALGPVIGGVIHDAFGMDAPFVLSALLSGLVGAGLLFSAPNTVPNRLSSVLTASETLPARPRGRVLLLMALELLSVLPIAFIEPELIVFAYGPLDLSATAFGVLISAYGLATVIGQGALGAISDRWGRRLVVRLGFFLSIGFYILLASAATYPLLILSAIVAGFGISLINPALTAAFLDGEEEGRSRLMGLKQAANGFGYALGPILVMFITGEVTSQLIFAMAAVLPIIGWILSGQIGESSSR